MTYTILVPTLPLDVRSRFAAVDDAAAIWTFRAYMEEARTHYDSVLVESLDDYHDEDSDCWYPEWRYVAEGPQAVRDFRLHDEPTRVVRPYDDMAPDDGRRLLMADHQSVETEMVEYLRRPGYRITAGNVHWAAHRLSAIEAMMRDAATASGGTDA